MMAAESIRTKFDWETARELLDMYRQDGEIVHGSLFDTSVEQSSWLRNSRSTKQTDFLQRVLTRLRPKTIVETGTHCGQFCLFARNLLDGELHIDTFSIEDRGETCVEHLNQKYGHYLDFHLGDSCKTLSAFSPSYQIDFIWLDGGHQYEVALSDLRNCARLQVPDLCVDDVNHEPVRRAIDVFLDENPRYEIIRQSADVGPTKKWRGVFYLSNVRKTQIMFKVKTLARKVLKRS